MTELTYLIAGLTIGNSLSNQEFQVALHPFTEVPMRIDRLKQRMQWAWGATGKGHTAMNKFVYDPL